MTNVISTTVQSRIESAVEEILSAEQSRLEAEGFQVVRVRISGRDIINGSVVYLGEDANGLYTLSPKSLKSDHPFHTASANQSFSWTTDGVKAGPYTFRGLFEVADIFTTTDGFQAALLTRTI